MPLSFDVASPAVRTSYCRYIALLRRNVILLIPILFSSSSLPSFFFSRRLIAHDRGAGGDAPGSSGDQTGSQGRAASSGKINTGNPEPTARVLPMLASSSGGPPDQARTGHYELVTRIQDYFGSSLRVLVTVTTSNAAAVTSMCSVCITQKKNDAKCFFFFFLQLSLRSRRA